MSWTSNWTDLIDQIESEKGWRVIENGSFRWIVYPPDKAMAVIHVSASRDAWALDNTRARLRRAGFMPLLRQQSARSIQVAHQLNNSKAQETPAPKQAAKEEPRDLIAEARVQIDRAVDALSALGALLTEISGEQEAMAKIKQLFQQVMKS
jgi:hypothetical protein